MLVVAIIVVSVSVVGVSVVGVSVLGVSGLVDISGGSGGWVDVVVGSGGMKLVSVCQYKHKNIASALIYYRLVFIAMATNQFFVIETCRVSQQTITRYVKFFHMWQSWVEIEY